MGMNEVTNKNWQQQRILKSEPYQEVAYKSVNEMVVAKREKRKLILDNDKELLDFMSCSYLGLDLDKRVIAAASQHLSELGVTIPTARTRLRANLFDTLEKKLNKIFADSFSVILRLCT